jgi:hypothetical protein
MVGGLSSDDDVRPLTGLKASGKRLWAAVAGPVSTEQNTIGWKGAGARFNP